MTDRIVGIEAIPSGHWSIAMKNLLVIAAALFLLGIGSCALMCGGMGSAVNDARNKVRQEREANAAKVTPQAENPAPVVEQAENNAPAQMADMRIEENRRARLRERERERAKLTAEEAEITYSNITWPEIDRIYNVRSKVTKIQKDELWKGYEGKRVLWSGSVSEISDTFGTLTLQIKMNPQTFSSDLLIRMKPEQRSVALGVAKDQRISFTGILDDWGTIMPVTLNAGEIVDPQQEAIKANKREAERQAAMEAAKTPEEKAKETEARAEARAKKAEEKKEAGKAKLEKTAASKVTLGKLSLKQGKKDVAKRWFTEAVKDFPDTEAAKEAEELLKGL